MFLPIKGSSTVYAIRWMEALVRINGCEKKFEGRVVNVWNRNEDELEVWRNLGGINLLEKKESITEEYKTLMKQDDSMKEWKKLAEKKGKGLRWVDGVTKKKYKDDIHGLERIIGNS